MKKTVSILGAVIALVVVSPASAKTLDGWWRFDDSSPTVAKDSSGNGNNGTVSGGAAKVSGYFGSALNFDGGTGEVDVPDSPSLEPSSAITFAAWVKGNNPEGNFKYIIDKGGWGCLTGSVGLYTGANGGLMFYIAQQNGLSTTISPDAGSGVWDGNWHLAIGTYDGSAVRLYVDGRQIGSGAPATGPIAYNLATTNDLFIGHYDSCPNLNFTGAIDEPTVWSRALGPAEVSVDYALLVGLHRFLGQLQSWPGT